MFAMHTDHDLKTQHNSTQMTSEIPQDASGGKGNNEEKAYREIMKTRRILTETTTASTRRGINVSNQSQTTLFIQQCLCLHFCSADAHY